jgi:hypothetical protein
MIKVIIKAVMVARAVLKVMYLNTLKGKYTS